MTARGYFFWACLNTWFVMIHWSGDLQLLQNSVDNKCICLHGTLPPGSLTLFLKCKYVCFSKMYLQVPLMPFKQKIKACGLAPSVYKSEIWVNNFKKSTIWIGWGGGQGMSVSAQLEWCLHAAMISMRSNVACLSRDNHTPRGLEALSWTLGLTTHLGCHYLMITILPVKPYCLIRGYEGDKTKRNRMNRT